MEAAGDEVHADACPNAAAGEEADSAGVCLHIPDDDEEAEEVAVDNDDALNPELEPNHCLNLQFLPPLQCRKLQIQMFRKLKVPQIPLPSFSFCLPPFV